MQITVIHEPTAEEPFLVVDKPAGLPSAPLTAGENSALSQALALYPQLAAVSGKKSLECGLVHRIDTATRGLVLIAASQSAYDSLFEAQKAGKFEKWYQARCDYLPFLTRELAGFPPPPLSAKPAGSFSLSSRFRPFGLHGAAVRPVTALSGEAALKKSGGRIYQTDIQLFPLADGAYRACCHILAGYRHQVRCHLAWCGFPVAGDQLYNPLVKENQPASLQFFATGLRFPNPFDGTIIDTRLHLQEPDPCREANEDFSWELV